MVKPFWAQVDVHVSTVMESVAKLYPVSARAPLSDTQPDAVQFVVARTLPVPVGRAALALELETTEEALLALALDTIEDTVPALEETVAAALELVVLAESADVAATEEA